VDNIKQTKMKNQKLAVLFLLTFIVGAAVMAVVDSKLKHPLLSKANSSIGDRIGSCWGFIAQRDDLYLSQTAGQPDYVEPGDYTSLEDDFKSCVVQALQ
jgi:hypothetical protein